MQEVFEKIIKRLEDELKLADEEKEKSSRENPLMFDNAKGYSAGVSNAIEIVSQFADKYLPGNNVGNNDWIPVSERLPEVPKEIEDEDCPEFNVTIKGATESTTLKYDGDGSWFDDFGYIYKVVAWQPLPKPYIPEENQTTPWKEHMMNRFMKGE